MTDQIDMISFKNSLIFWFISKPLTEMIYLILMNHLILFSVDGFDINQNIRKFLNKSCQFDLSFWFFLQWLVYLDYHFCVHFAVIFWQIIQNPLVRSNYYALVIYLQKTSITFLCVSEVSWIIELYYVELVSRSIRQGMHEVWTKKTF